MIRGARVRVVGGGMIGMSVAWQLSKSGAAVTVFEAGRVGQEASWAGAGMLAPGGEISQPSRLSALALESLRMYPDFVAELSDQSGVPIDFRQCGAFSLAYSETEADSLHSLASAQSELGIYSEQFSPTRVPGVRAGATAAQYYPEDAVVNPRDVIRALGTACRRIGVMIHEGESVTEITDASAFDITVLAAGAWSDQIKVILSGETVTIPKVSPVRGHLIAFDLTASSTDSSICDAIVRHNHTYLFHRSANVPGSLVIAGATSEHCGFDQTVDGSIAEQLAESAAALMPALSGCGYSAWTGLRPATENGQPVIERLGDSSIWMAYGHYRNGILLAPATAQLIAKEINQANSGTGSPSPGAPRQ